MNKNIIDEAMQVVARVVAVMGICIALCVVADILVGCTPQKEVVVERHTDTLLVKQLHRDSIYLKDSVYVREYARGCTIFVDKAKMQIAYRDKLVHDTIVQTKTQTQTQTKVVVEKPTLWDKLKQMCFGALVMAGVGILAYIGIKKWAK